jgi:hypothetical protein
MMEVMAPGHQFEEEVSSAEGRQAYLRDAQTRGSRKEARKEKRGERRQRRQGLRADIRSGKTTRKEARAIRKDWRRATAAELKAAITSEFNRLKSIAGANRKLRKARKAAPVVYPIPPADGIAGGPSQQFVKPIPPVTKKPDGSGTKNVNGTVVNVPKNDIVNVPGPGGASVPVDKADVQGKPIKLDANGNATTLLSQEQVDLALGPNGATDFFEVADVGDGQGGDGANPIDTEREGRWATMSTGAKIGIIAGGVVLLGGITFAIVKLSKRGKK